MLIDHAGIKRWFSTDFEPKKEKVEGEEKAEATTMDKKTDGGAQ